MQPVSDATMRTIAQALAGLKTRADVRADNLANVNTPGFRAQQVDFESVLANKVRRGNVDRPLVAVKTAAPNLPNPQGNTVSLEGEITGMMKDNLLRDALINSFNTKANAFRSAIGSR